MSEDKSKLEQAKRLIRAGKYDEARNILKTDQHPQSRRLLEKLKKQQTKATQRTRRILLIAMLGIFISVPLLIGVLLLFSGSDSTGLNGLPTRFLISEATPELTPEMSPEATPEAEATLEASITAEDTPEIVVIVDEDETLTPIHDLEIDAGELIVELLPTTPQPIVTEIVPVTSARFTAATLITASRTLDGENIDEQLRLVAGIYRVRVTTADAFSILITTLEGTCQRMLALPNIGAGDGIDGANFIIRVEADCTFGLSVEADSDDWELVIEQISADDAVEIQPMYSQIDHNERFIVIDPVILPEGLYLLAVEATGDFLLSADRLAGQCTADVGLLVIDRANEIEISQSSISSSGCIIVLSITATDDWTLTISE